MTVTAVRDGVEERYREALLFSRSILPLVSRTFAIGISYLPGDLGTAVVVGYLMCRIADTIEDDAHAPAELRSRLLARFMECFDDVDAAEEFGRDAAAVQGSEHDIACLRRTGDVFLLYRTLSPQTQSTLLRWVGELVRGMQRFVERYPAGIRIRTLPEYREYCYYVAGTVGHLLTELWREHSLFIDDRVYDRLLLDCEAFGEAQQTVNIIRDIASDADRENSVYVPQDALVAVGSSQEDLFRTDLVTHNRAALEGLIGLAHEDLEASLRYISAIPLGAFRIRLFCIIPTLLAAATLRELERSSEMLVPGQTVKIGRPEVKALVMMAPVAAVSNIGVRWLVDRVRREPFLIGAA
jgi:farnesyl-diphosphate farnesyltransferase